MADYYINSDKGKELANRLQAGDMAEASDGSLWKKEADGSITVTKNGQTMTGKVGVSAPIEPAAPEYTPEQPSSVDTPVLDGANQTAPSYSLQQDATKSAITPAQTEQVLASEKARQATDAVTAGLTQDGEKAKISDEQLNDAVQQALQPEYRIGSAKGVSLSEKLQRAGDMAEASDGSLWTRNEDGSITVKKDGKTYTATIDREAAKRDAQQTAAPASSGTGSAGGSYSGGSGTYASASSGTQKPQASAQTTSEDRATLRKQAATAQKEMGDLARQIAAKKAQGKDASALQAQYAEAKARYDAATAKIDASSAELTLTRQATGPEIKAAAASGQNARGSYSVQYTDTPSRAEVKRSYQERKEEAQKEARENAWQSLPTVADADRFTINEAADAQTRETEQQLFDSARNEVQKNAWRSLPTVKDADRFSIPSQTDSLIQQAIASAPKTLSGKPYLPENTGGFSHSSGKAKSTVDRDAALQMNIAMANDDYDTIRRIREKNNYLSDNESVKYLAERAGTGLLGAIQGVGNALSYLFQAKEPEGYDWDNPVMTGAQFAESVSDIKQSFSFADTAAQKMAQRYAGRNIPAAQQTAGAVAEGVAGMIPTIAANVAVPGSSLYVLFAQAAGSATTDALQRGATGQQAVTYGVASGALEVLTEKMFDGVAGVFGKGAADDALQSIVRRVTQNEGAQTALLAIADSLGEGFEEFVSEFGDKLLSDMLIKDDSRSFRQVLDDAGESFLVGALTSAVMQAAGSITKRTTPKQAAEQVSEALHEDIQQEAINSNVRAAAEQSPLDRSILETMRPEAFQQPAQAALYDTQQTTQPTAEQGTGSVITGENAKKISMEDFANNESSVWNNVAYEDEKTKNAIMRKTHNDMIKNGEVVTIPENVTNDVASHFPDMRGVSKADRTPVLKQKLAELKTNLRRYLSGLKGASYEFDVNGNVLDARLYDTGIREVMDRVTQEKSNMLFGSDQIFRSAQYLYSTPDYDSNPNVYRWNYFYTPVQIGDQTVGVRIAVRDMKPTTGSVAESQIYHWGIKKDAALDGGHPGETPKSAGVSSATSFNSTVPQYPDSVNQNLSANDMGAMRSRFESVPKQSQTQSNTISGLEAEWNVPDAQRTPLYYDTISEAKSLDNARLRLAQDYAGEMAELRGKHNWSGEEVDMGMTILDNYRRAAEQTGDWTEYSNWRKEVQAHGTAAGQALQAYAKYSRQTGGGIVADASAALERAAKKTNKADVMDRVNTLAKQYDSAVGTGQENAKVNVNDLVDIIKSASTVRQTGTLIGNKMPPIVEWAMKRIANYARAEAQSGGGENLDFLKTFAADSIYNIAADTRAVSGGEKVKSARRMAMLSKVSTVMRNLVSNNVFDPVDSIARDVSVPLDILVSKITGTRSVALDGSWFSAAKRKGSMDGLARACMEVGLDVNTSGGAGKYENSANRTFKMSGGVVSKLMSTWEAYEGYTLNATDEFQKGGIEASVQKGIDRLYERGKIKDDSLRNAGQQEALYRTFQDKTVLSDAAIGVRNALNKAHVGDIGAGDIILPFAQVPSNLGARAIEYSPAGLAVAAADFINLIDSAQKGNFTAADQAKAVQGVGRALTGSGMIAIAAAGALRGWLKVTGDDEDKNKDALAKTHGLDGTQLNISAALRDLRGESVEWQNGDQLLSIGFLDPLNAQLTTGALIADDIREESVTAGRVFGNSLSGALQSVLDTPVMSTLQDVATNYNYSDAETAGGKMLDAAQKYAANQLSSVIPNSLRGIAQGLDDTERNAYSSDNVWQQVVDNAKASIPGLRETLPAKTDVWGNPIKNEGGVRNFLNRNVNPGFVTTYKQDDVSTELEKISEATGNSLYPDRTAPRSVKVDGESVSLTFEQRSMYQKAYGDAYSAAITALMGDKKYQSMPDSMKAEILKQAKSVATEQARDSLGIGYEMQTSAQKILDKSGADRNDALIAAAVKAQHYMSEDTRKKLSKVNQAFSGADYVGLSDEITDSAKEKANAYFSAVEAAKYGGELTQTQKELADKDSMELARYFMDKAIESHFSDTNKNGTKADEYLKAYEAGEINDAVALSVLSDKEVRAYDRFGRSAKVTPKMALQAANAHAGIKDITDDDGKVITSAEDQFDAWLDKQSWTDDQKSAIRMGFYTDSAKTYGYLADQLRKGNIDTASAKSELSSSYQAGWTHNVKDTGAKMADYIDAVVEYLERPSEDERKAAGYKNTWSWFCDYLNTTSMTREQKFGIAISMSDYADSTKQKIWDRLR